MQDKLTQLFNKLKEAQSIYQEFALKQKAKESMTDSQWQEEYDTEVKRCLDVINNPEQESELWKICQSRVLFCHRSFDQDYSVIRCKNNKEEKLAKVKKQNLAINPHHVCVLFCDYDGTGTKYYMESYSIVPLEIYRDRILSAMAGREIALRGNITRVKKSINKLEVSVSF